MAILLVYCISRLRWYILGKHSSAVFTSNRNTEESQSEECLIDSSTVFVSDILKEADIIFEPENNEMNETFIQLLDECELDVRNKIKNNNIYLLSHTLS